MDVLRHMMAEIVGEIIYRACAESCYVSMSMNEDSFLTGSLHFMKIDNLYYTLHWTFSFNDHFLLH